MGLLEFQLGFIKQYGGFYQVFNDPVTLPCIGYEFTIRFCYQIGCVYQVHDLLN